jgi:hypothetical protein
LVTSGLYIDLYGKARNILQGRTYDGLMAVGEVNPGFNADFCARQGQLEPWYPSHFTICRAVLERESIRGPVNPSDREKKELSTRRTCGQGVLELLCPFPLILECLLAYKIADRLSDGSHETIKQHTQKALRDLGKIYRSHIAFPS